MPVISVFDGIKIMMYYDDHNPPHFHAVYAEHTALIDITDGCVMEGKLPSRQLKFVLAWSEMHQDELLQNWERSKNSEQLQSIAPLM